MFLTIVRSALAGVARHSSALLAADAAAPPLGGVRPSLPPLSALCKSRTGGRPSSPSGTSVTSSYTSYPSQPYSTLQSHPSSPINLNDAKRDTTPPHITNSQWSQLGSYNDTQTLLLMHGIEPNPGPQDTKQLTIAHININSITADGKKDELEQFIIANDIQILALTETKLDSNVANSEYFITDFHPPLTKHRTRYGGGVALYFHKTLPAQRLLNIEIGDEEWVWAKVKTPNFTLLISCIYLISSTKLVNRTTYHLSRKFHRG